MFHLYNFRCIINFKISMWLNMSRKMYALYILIHRHTALGIQISADDCNVNIYIVYRK